MMYAVCLVYSIAIICAYRLGLSDGSKLGIKEPISMPNIVKPKSKEEPKISELEQEQKERDKAIEDFINNGGMA